MLRFKSIKYPPENENESLVQWEMSNINDGKEKHWMEIKKIWKVFDEQIKYTGMWKEKIHLFLLSILESGMPEKNNNGTAGLPGSKGSK